MVGNLPLYPIVLKMPNGELHYGWYRWLNDGETNANGKTLSVEVLHNVNDAYLKIFKHLQVNQDPIAKQTIDVLHPWGPDPKFCELCFAGDGDARCMLCGISSGGYEVCICSDGPTLGPCALKEL